MLKTLPMIETGTTIPALLRATAHGDAVAPVQLLPLIYDELRRVARNYMRRERADHSLQPTALVHEAYARLSKNQERDAISRTHFFRLSAHAMRQVLVDHARARICEKRNGGGNRVTLVENLAASPLTDDGVLRLNDALTELEKLAPRGGPDRGHAFLCGQEGRRNRRGSGDFHQNRKTRLDLRPRLATEGTESRYSIVNARFN